MSDYLVKLYCLPAIPVISQAEIRHPIGPEKHVIVDWVRNQFGAGWASEAEVAFSNHGLLIACYGNQMLGFGCYDATVKGFFGPTGVHPEWRGKGLGKALLLSCLHAMKDAGYGYAIIGDGIPDFYQKNCGAVEIPDSQPGVYRGIVNK